MPGMVQISYEIAEAPVTNREYERFDPGHARCAASDQDDQPVVNVSWDDAVGYCKWLTEHDTEGRAYRLPTEVEWKYACRAGGKGEYGMGRDGQEITIENLKDYAVYDANKTTPVGSRLPNAFGLYDMHGNVWEWCQDWYDATQQTRVLRGGSWTYHPGSLRVSCRYYDGPGSRIDDIGFRVVASFARTPR